MEKKESLDSEVFLNLVQSLTDVVYEINIVYKIDEQGRFTFVNDVVRQLGYEPEELIGQHYSMLIHPADIENVSRSSVLPRLEGREIGDANAPKLFDERRTRSRSTKNLEVRLISKDKKVCVGEVTASGHYTPHVKSEDKEFCGTIGVIRNVTERKRLEEQLRSTMRASSVRILAGGIAHDFNNLIMIANGYLDLIKERGTLDEQQRGYHERAKEAIKTATGLTEKLKSLSKGTFSKKTDVDVYEIAKKVFGLLNRPEYSDVNKIIDLQPREFYIHINEYDITEILLNLAINSLESIQERGAKEGDYVRISAEDYVVKDDSKIRLPKGEYIYILFEDNGIGMTEDVRIRAFDPWFTTKQKGDGIGLAIVDNIVKAENKGCIYIESVENKGTTFHIYLPKGSKE